MKKTNRHILLGLMGASSLLLVSCSSSSKSGDYATYPSSGYGNYGADSYSSTGNDNTANDTYASSGGGGGAYPTTPQNYGTDYGSTGGGAAAPSTSGQTHTVQKGETLYRIGVNYGTTVSNIKAANGLTSDLIRPGDVLVVR